MRPQPREHGVIFLLVLVILTTVTTLAFGLAYRTRIELRMAATHARRVQAHYLALGGITRGLAQLALKPENPDDPQGPLLTNASDEGLFEDLDESPTWPMSLDVRLVDEQAFVRLDVEQEDTLERLLGRALTTQILDWIDEDDVPTGADGVERFAIAGSFSHFLAKNAPFENLRELLYLKDVAIVDYGSEDFNLNGDLDEDEQDSLASLPIDNGDYLLDRGLRDRLTVVGDGRINVNTAPPEVLAALPGFDELSANQIVTYRNGSDGQLGTDDDQLLSSTANYSDITGLSSVHTDVLRQYGCFTSNNYRISAAARWQDQLCGLSATVDASMNPPQIITLEKLH